MTSLLTTPKEAESLLARLFASGPLAHVKVSENRAFKDSWLDLGSLKIDAGGDKPRHILTAVRRGGFEWSLPPIEDVETSLLNLLGLKEADRKSSKLRRTVDAMGAIAMRLGLRYPRLDPSALEGMPFKRSTTVVADTSAIIQGGLDFVARHLHPAARVKVPAIAQMEIVNFSERFLSTRRASKLRPLDLLLDHMLSQGGQRVLLRLELNTDTEIERNFLLGDPLRNAFQKDSDPDLQELNLSVRIKAYADRLILESARQHQAQSNLGHKVQLLTSDQGLARMALSEGIVPAYFSSVVAGDLFGRRLTGTNLDPFTGRLRECSLAAVLWELATTFGGVQIQSESGDRTIDVAAFGDGLSWSPVQSHADLLWCDHQGCEEPKAPVSIVHEDGNIQTSVRLENTEKRTAKSVNESKSETIGKVKEVSLQQDIRPQRFNVNHLIALIDALDTSQELTESEVIRLSGAKNRIGTGDYRRFLLSGKLATVTGNSWKPTSRGAALAIALRNEDSSGVLAELRSAPSFEQFVAQVQNSEIGVVIAPGSFDRAFSTYRTLGEITLVCAPIYGEGVFSTPNAPTVEEFAPIAIAQFKSLDFGDGLVSTGAWLEQLIKQEGIHPEIARARLSDASGAGLLHRSTEGSTTDVRNAQHVLQVLRSRSGHPVIEQVHLYRGDYLIPGKASTSLRILEPVK